MEFDARKLLSIEEKLRKDLDAVQRVKRMMALEAAEGGGHDADADDADLEAPVTSLRGTIQQLLNANPEKRWTAQQVLSALKDSGYPLRAKQPIYSVGQTLNILAKKQKIRIVRRGTGSAPHIYKGRIDDPSLEIHSRTGGEVGNESSLTN